MYWRLLLLVTATLAYDWQMYEGHRVVQFTPNNAEQVAVVDKFALNNGVTVLKDPIVGRKTDILVSGDLFGAFKSTLVMNGMHFTISDRNVALELRNEWTRMEVRGFPSAMIYDPADFNTRVDIEGEMDRLAGLCAGNGLTCSTTFLTGSTLSTREIKVFTMSANSGATASILIDSLIHCREWLAGATSMSILTKMVNDYGTDADVTNIVNANDFVFIPIMNPDGYDFTFSDDRYWRKNRRNNDGACFGVDLNRNWDSNWSGPGASDSPCSDTYYGTSAASEPETAAVANFISSYSGPAFRFGFSMHSYGYYLLHPYGTCDNPANAVDIVRVSNAGCNAIENTHGTNWDCGNSCQVLYATSGGSIDWEMESAGFEYAYTPEMRGADFVVVPAQIPLSAEELWNGLLAMWAAM